MSIATTEQLEHLARQSKKYTKDTAENINAQISALPSENEIQEWINNANHLKRTIVGDAGSINVNADDADQYIYMVPKSDAENDDSYDEYMVINNTLEHIGSTSVNLENYLTKDMVATNEEVAEVIDPLFTIKEE